MKEIQEDRLAKDADVIQCSEFIVGSILRPEKIQWVSAVEYITTIEQHFRKRSDYIRWDEAIRSLEKQGYIFQKEQITDEKFKNFYDFYKQHMEEKERGDVLLPRDWVEKHTDHNDVLLGYFCYKNDVLRGGLIGFMEPGADDVRAGYLAVDHESGGITCGLQNLLLQDLIVSGRSHLTYGKDRNFYGIYASPGLIYNKSKFGLSPYFLAGIPLFSTLILQKHDEKDWMFFSPVNPKDPRTQLDLVIISDDFKDSIEKYRSVNVRSIHVRNTNDVLYEHRAVFEKL